MGATEECVSLMLLCIVGTISVTRSVSWQWVREVGLRHRNAFTCWKLNRYKDWRFTGRALFEFLRTNISKALPPPSGIWALDLKVYVLTCEHAFIDDAGATDQYSVTWHDGSIAGDDHQITGHQICRQNLLDFCQVPGCNGGVEKVNIKQHNNKQN